jgi:hypothetical protein
LELADIDNFKGFRTIANQTYESAKLFASSLEDASNFGWQNFTYDQKPFTIVSTKMPGSVISTTLHPGGMDTMNGIYAIPSDLLKNAYWITQYNNVAIPNFWLYNSSK